MNLGLRTILLLVAVVLFVIALFSNENFSDLLALGLAAFAGAFLATRSASPTAPSTATAATRPGPGPRSGPFRDLRALPDPLPRIRQPRSSVAESAGAR